MNNHFLNMLLILLFAFLLLNCSQENPVSNNKTNYLDDLGKEVHGLVNLHRTSIGLPELEWSEIIASECRTHSIDMANSKTINHDGFYERIDRIKEKFP